ncbi:LuxR C-terminal-related transcriptional regulator [Thermomonospora catenispora]|uniref:LuxR C-terminal-related transcriptional regulator n=1 Tax=Thermomonospora catenispora TaxID=2493090 RepID=UPI001120E727|nr:LuxR C-terminal-related transcriptional regulator [Thermomonospora catenispora]TNY35373.1 LuxR family transcriptional regulator [Thermomonospora catenispora]
MSDHRVPARWAAPPPPERTVARPRLLRLLRRGVRGPLTVVVGPPGSGKTAAVTAWAAARPRSAGPVLWVSGDRLPTPVERPWERPCGASDRSSAPAADAVAGPTPRTDADALAADIAALPARLGVPVAVVIDDLRAEPGSAAAAFAAGLLGRADPGLCLVVTARGDPPLPLRRYALEGRLTEIRTEDLAFDDREIAAVLAQHGVRLGPASLRALAERTGGWAAGVRLAALAMEARPDPEEFAAQFAGDDPAVVAYLLEEVLDPLPAGVRGLLLRTSVVDRVDAGLAATLAGEEAGRAFAETVRRNAFFTPLGHGRYRWHPMIREAFALLLRHESPAEVPELHRRAAAWFDRAGRLTEAVRQALRAQEWGYAARLVVDRLAIGRVLGLCPADPLTDLFGSLPGRLVFTASEPEPAVVVAAVEAAGGDDRACAAALRHADGLMRNTRDASTRAARLCAALVRLAGPRSRDVPGSGDLTDEPLGLLGGLPEQVLRDRPEARALLLSARADTALHGGRLPEAARLFEAALSAAVQAGGDFQHRSCLGHLALVEALLGRFGRAAELVGRAARLPEVSACPPGRRVAAAHLAGAWVHLERYELDRARVELDKAGRASRARPDPLLSALRRMIEARLENARDRPERALRTLGDIGGSAPRTPWLERRLWLVAAEAQTALGAPDAAALAAELAGGAAHADAAVALARAELSRGRTVDAADMMRRVLAEPAGVPIDVQVEARLLDARLSYAGRDPAQGRRALDRALRLAERGRIRLPFARSRRWLRPILRRDPELARPHAGLLDPLRMVDAAEAPAHGGRAETTVVERPSPREADVLACLARMMSTEEIAAELCLSPNTVKTHLKHVYRKLGVTRRADAVRRARRLSIL